MGYMTIDGRKVEFTDEPNVLSVIRNADIDIPTLCYHSELSVYGACRLCTVEVREERRLHPVQNRQEMGWSFTRILRVL